jgi:hypothetical protein
VSRYSPFAIVLSDAGRKVLDERARAYTLPHVEVVRAKIVLLAADGVANTDITLRVRGIEDEPFEYFRRERTREKALDWLRRRRSSQRNTSGSPPSVLLREVSSRVRSMHGRSIHIKGRHVLTAVAVTAFAAASIMAVHHDRTDKLAAVVDRNAARGTFRCDIPGSGWAHFGHT